MDFALRNTVKAMGKHGNPTGKYCSPTLQKDRGGSITCFPQSVYGILWAPVSLTVFQTVSCTKNVVLFPFWGYNERKVEMAGILSANEGWQPKIAVFGQPSRARRKTGCP